MMTLLINILILFFLFLIVYSLFLAYYGKHIEGMATTTYTYTDYATPISSIDPVVLGQQNANNIMYLKSMLDNTTDNTPVDGLYQEVQDLSANVAQLNTQMNQVVQAEADYCQQMLPSTPPVITGT